MPRRSAKPPYEIFRNAPPTTPPAGRHSAKGGAAPVSSLSRSRASGRGRRVLRLPDASTVFAAMGRLGATVAEKARAGSATLGDQARALRQLWAQRRGQLALRRAEAAAKNVKVVESAAGAWWIASGKPVVLRMTRGLVVLAIAGVVGLVLLAYWLGRGDATLNFADTWPDQNQSRPVSDVALDRPDAVVDVPGGSDPEAGVVVPTPRTTPPPAADPRVPGRNYLVYTMTDLTTAKELAAFLRDQDARIRIVPTEHPAPGAAARKGELAGDPKSGDTSVLHLVVDVTEGFTRAQYTRGEHHRFLSERLALGRAWKRHNGDRGSALESMTFYKYDAKTNRG